MLDGGPSRPLPLHQDSTIDTRAAFDVQLFHDPRAVTGDMGGTRFLAGGHLRLVDEDGARDLDPGVLAPQPIFVPGAWDADDIPRARCA